MRALHSIRFAFHRHLVWAACVPVVLISAGCSTARSVTDAIPSVNVANMLTPYKIDIQQGNVLTKDQTDQIKVGMSREQVRFILGTPMHASLFRADRWDYIYRYDANGKFKEQRAYSLFFQNDRIAKIEGEDAPVNLPFANKPNSRTVVDLATPVGTSTPSALNAPVAVPAPSAPAAVPVPAPAPEVKPAMEPKPSAAPAPAPSTASVPAAAAVGAAPDITATNRAPTAVEQEGLVEVLETWRRAYVSRDLLILNRYLGNATSAADRATYSAQDAALLAKAKDVQADTNNIRIQMLGNNKAQVVFSVDSTVDGKTSTQTRTWVLGKVAQRWVIESEQR